MELSQATKMIDYKTKRSVMPKPRFQLGKLEP